MKLLVNSTLKDTAEKLRTTEKIGEGIINRKISTAVDWTKTTPKIIGIDEIALRKGHSQYLTIVSDITVPKQIKLLAVIKGRTRDDILPFLKKIPKEVLLSLEGITIDMSASYYSAVKELFDDGDTFNRIVTIDRFHVAKLLGEKVDKERKKVLKQLKQEFENDDNTLNQLKDTMWPFRHHKADLDDDENERLETLFKLEPNLRRCYDLGTKIK